MRNDARPDEAEAMTTSAKKRRRNFTAGFRALLMLAMIVQWAVAAHRQHQDVLAIEREGGQVFYSWQWEIRYSEHPHSPPPFPAFLAKHLQEDYFGPIVAVHLKHREIDPRVVRRVAHFPRLRELSVIFTPIDDQDLLTLSGLSELEHLELFDTKIKGPGLRVLARMKKLEDLDLGAIPVTDDEFLAVSRLTRLKSLKINSASLADAGLKSLASLRNLTVLRINGGDGATEAGFAFLESLTELTDLELYGLPAPNLFHLRHLQKLSRLELADSKVSDLSHLRNLTMLKDFRVWRVPINERELRFLKDLPSLTSLQLVDVRITKAGMAHFEPLDRLETLDLWLENFRGPGLGSIAKMKSLRNLFLGGNFIGDDEISALCESKSIRFLEIRNTKVTGAGLLNLKNLKSLKSIVQPDGILDDDNIDYYRDQLRGITLYY